VTETRHPHVVTSMHSTVNRTLSHLMVEHADKILFLAQMTSPAGRAVQIRERAEVGDEK
jgi:hypothetical protein